MKTITLPASFKNNLVAIAAMGEHREIGKNNGLCFRDPQDLALFKNLTEYGVIIVGRKTLDSLPGGGLPNRHIVCLTTDSKLLAQKTKVGTTVGYDIHYVESVESAIKKSKSLNVDDHPIYVAGGAEIYQAFSDKLTGLFLSFFDSQTDEEADTFLPPIERPMILDDTILFDNFILEIHRSPITKNI